MVAGRCNTGLAAGFAVQPNPLEEYPVRFFGVFRQQPVFMMSPARKVRDGSNAEVAGPFLFTTIGETRSSHGNKITGLGPASR